MIRKPPAPPSTNRIGIDVTRAPIGKASLHPGPWPMTSPTNS